ncbi:hypothetical protein AJ79_04511 [Helicocarpus griseus UAMH5409]|uniref:Uncharacterized protein n=1 Tax=Helicocarpus griseus UAMH5409 TaxID=1447875 RepID=A0A2B7XTN8_9EURO|nr:hypothetical protein AJ79_04511 [Helicocarpus griseus UAMH5409]
MASIRESLRSVSSSSNPASKSRPTSALRKRLSLDLLTLSPTSSIATTSSVTSSPKNNTRPELVSYLEELTRNLSGFPQTEPDNLPQDLDELEGIINYHLSQLGQLRIEIAQHNETIDKLAVTSSPENLNDTAQKLHVRVQGARNARNLLSRFLKFHLLEIGRIVELKWKITGKKEFPEIYKSLPTYNDLRDMFEA